ncbi:aminobenzoyl-glutamate utilization protein A [Kushneria pakistanensis]|uniref:Aminobenzoyl-glutamate utilization protein A n=1 Tax=Kushneria pakistanensis TaxID=1508770 RepID=A0ABQ3FMB8_9GAMM|nr:amidohydrolase [Kushneria pakistanensis]GHC29662.1 aminobenzoyl-glutamate utilization protein A [Kushneria pakistanensis]
MSEALSHTLDHHLDTLTPQLTAWRRDFHQYAESGWVEFRTASIVAEELDRLGYAVTLGRDVVDETSRMGVPDADTLAREEARAKAQGAIERWLPQLSGGFTGVIGVLDTGRPGPTIGYRIDLDALDLEESREETHRPAQQGFGSKNAGMMHACGHDGHTTIGLGLARLFKTLESELSGRIKLIFQPAEEGVRGARSMVEAGTLDDVDIFIATHIGTGVPRGEVVCGQDGYLATTKLDVAYTGVPAHAGGKPEEGRNALLAAAQAAVGLHAIPRHSAGVSRINVGVLNAGSGRNVVPASATMKIETRGENTAINEEMRRRAIDVIEGAARMHGVSVEYHLAGEADTCTSSPELVDYIHGRLQGLPGIEVITPSINEPSGSEDATCMMKRVQDRGGLATYMVFGTELAAGHHHQCFDFDEDVLPLAVRSLAHLAFNIDLPGARHDR